MSTICIPYEKPTVSENVVTPSGGPILFSFKVGPMNATMVYSEQFTTAALRLARLKRYAWIFSVLFLIFAAAAIGCLVARLPYEPASAVSISLLGIAIVFIMKIRDVSQ